MPCRNLDPKSNGSKQEARLMIILHGYMIVPYTIRALLKETLQHYGGVLLGHLLSSHVSNA